MSNNPVEQARHSIHHVHELIQRVFTNADGAGEAAIVPLMDVFAEDFGMVTTTAAVVGRAQVEHLFKSGVGARPGLEIAISDVHTVWHEGATVALRYKETHRQNQQETSRISLAILHAHHHSTRWLYLHETPIAQEKPA